MIKRIALMLVFSACTFGFCLPRLMAGERAVRPSRAWAPAEVGQGTIKPEDAACIEMCKDAWLKCILLRCTPENGDEDECLEGCNREEHDCEEQACHQP
jgi:hypothetical protein